MKTQKTLNTLIFIFVFFTVAVLITRISASRAGVAMGAADQSMAFPEPPAENPHPPVTDQDKKRVTFAEEVIKKVLMMDMSGFVADNLPAFANNDRSVNLKINAACLADTACLKNNKTTLNYVHSINQMYGQVVEFRHTHVIPWAFENFEKNKSSVNQNDTASLIARPTQKYLEKKAAQEAMAVPVLQKDEYMLHTYVKFGKNHNWYHVNTIVSEDTRGNLEFRQLFILVMPTAHDDLPPGAVC